MGSRNFDRLPFARQAEGVHTIADMRAARWKVMAKCDACGLVVNVSLAAAARVLSPDAELWGRRPKCPKVGCSGRQTYMAVLPGGASGDLIELNRIRRGA